MPQLSTPLIDVLPGQVVTPRNLSHRRPAHTDLAQDRPLLSIRPSTPPLRTSHNLLPHIIPIANDVVNDVNNDSGLVENPPLHKAVATGRLQPTLLRLLLWDLQPLPPPGALAPFHVHRPTGFAQEGSDPAVAVAPILRGERDNVRDQRVFIGPALRHLPLCRAMLPQCATGEPFRDAELLPDMLNACTAVGGAQKFPEAAFSETGH